MLSRVLCGGTASPASKFDFSCTALSTWRSIPHCFPKAAIKDSRSSQVPRCLFEEQYNACSWAFVIPHVRANLEFADFQQLRPAILPSPLTTGNMLMMLNPTETEGDALQQISGVEAISLHHTGKGLELRV